MVQRNSMKNKLSLSEFLEQLEIKDPESKFASLSEREQFCLKEYTDGNLSLEKIGRQLHLSRERIRQILTVAKRKLLTSFADPTTEVIVQQNILPSLLSREQTLLLLQIPIVAFRYYIATKQLPYYYLGRKHKEVFYRTDVLNLLATIRKEGLPEEPTRRSRVQERQQILARIRETKGNENTIS